MRFWGLLLLCLSAVGWANESITLLEMASGWEKLAEPPRAPHFEVEGFIEGVSVVTGCYQATSLDWEARGIDPLRIERSYFRPNRPNPLLYTSLDAPNQKGWYFNYDDFLYLTSSEDNACIGRRSGGLLYVERDRRSSSFTIPSKVCKGYTNTSAGVLSGQNFLKNICMKKAGDEYLLTMPDGAVRRYGKRHSAESYSIEHLPSLYISTLKEISLPSGNRVIRRDGRWVTISKDGVSELNWYKVSKGTRDGAPTSVDTSDGRHFEYHALRDAVMRNGYQQNFLSKCVRPDGTEIRYHYDLSHKQNDLLKRIEYPDGRFLSIHYTDYPPQGKEFPGGYKVSKLVAPVGTEGSAEPVYTFKYGKNRTDVWDANGNRVRYEYNDEKRLEHKIEWDKEKRARRMRQVWTGDGKLKVKVLLDGDGHVILARHFHYDGRGNVTCEQMYGNLTGRCTKPIELDPSFVPIDNGVECYTKHYTYYDGPLNLLKSESDEIGSTEYRYLEGTNLLSVKFVGDHSGIRLRQFRSYDHAGALATLIEDDGQSQFEGGLTGCSVRKITRIRNRDRAPGIGLPQFVDELYWDFETNQEVLIKRTGYQYNSHNECVREDVYNERKVLAYSIFRDFDELGRCVYETDPDGGEYFRKYDASGNLTQEIGPNPEHIVEHGYDLSNRRIWTREYDGTGQERTTRYRYDSAGNKVAEIDAGGNETTFTYDGVGREISRTLPPTLDLDDRLVSHTLTKAYDAADNIIEIIDERGDQTFSTYNIRGQPITILGRESEQFYYDLRGNCVEKIDAVGTVTRFVYDFLDRVVETETYDVNGELLTSLRNTYNPFGLTSTTDGEGHITYFYYDGAGRERCVVSGEKKNEKKYDFLGRVVHIRDWYGYDDGEYTAKRIAYDYRGNVLQETCEDSSGKVYEKRTYTYNRAGYRTRITTYADHKTPHTSKTTYDQFGRPLTHTDPQGATTKISYRDDLPNPFQQLCPYKKEVDPLGTITESYFDARYQLIHLVRTNSFGEKVAEQEFRYDGKGNLIQRRDRKNTNNWQKIQFHYTREGKYKKIIEHASGGRRRETYFSYDQAGRLVCRSSMLATHTFLYDGLGRVSEHFADSLHVPAIHTAYHYDANGKVIEAIQDGLSTTREYDAHGNLLMEQQATGNQVFYTYDRQGRRTRMTLPDRTSIAYVYCGPHLREIKRQNASLKTAYTHTYLERDLSGNVTHTQFIGKAGIMQQAYDSLGRLAEIATPHWGQTLTYDRVGNLVNSTIRDPAGTDTLHYHYDSRSRLVGEEDRCYEYDGLDNRLDGEIGAYNQLQSGAGCTFSWDASGQLTHIRGRKSASCTYDALGRLIRYNETTYTYDAFNRRISKGLETFLYDGDNEIGLYSKKKKRKQLRVLGEGKGGDLSATVVIEMGNRFYVPVHDVQGSITALLDAKSGKIAEHYRYTAFGEKTTYATNGIPTHFSFTGNSWGFSSKRCDDESGWVFFGRRYYIPEIARWTTIDPLGYGDGANLYAYVHNNPLTHYDLYGYYDEREHQVGARSCSDFLGSSVRALITAVERIGQHLIPVPGMRDVHDSVGRWGMGGLLFRLYIDNESRCGIVTVGDIKIPGHTYIHTNGIWTTGERAVEAGRNFSQQSGGIETLVLSKETTGWIDVFEVGLYKCGYVGESERALVEVVKQILDESPDEMIHITAHSLGGQRLYNAGKVLFSTLEREHISVDTIGSPKLIPDTLFHKVRNYASDFDFVPLFDLVNYVSARIGLQENVEFISPSSLHPIHEHGIMNPTYDKVVGNLGREIIKNHL